MSWWTRSIDGRSNIYFIKLTFQVYLIGQVLHHEWWNHDYELGSLACLALSRLAAFRFPASELSQSYFGNFFKWSSQVWPECSWTWWMIRKCHVQVGAAVLTVIGVDVRESEWRAWITDQLAICTYEPDESLRRLLSNPLYRSIVNLFFLYSQEGSAGTSIRNEKRRIKESKRREVNRQKTLRPLESIIWNKVHSWFFLCTFS